MSKTKRTAAEVIEAIKGTSGIKTVIAQNLGVTRETFDSYLRRWPTVRRAFEQERQTFVDIAESVVVRNVKLAHKKQSEGEMVDSADSKWVVSRLGKDRGYSERMEMNILKSLDLSKLTDDQIDRLAEGEDVLSVLASSVGS